MSSVRKMYRLPEELARRLGLPDGSGLNAWDAPHPVLCDWLNALNVPLSAIEAVDMPMRRPPAATSSRALIGERPPYLCGDAFAARCETVWAQPGGLAPERNRAGVPGTVFLHLHNIGPFFRNHLPGRPFVLVTGNCDEPVNERYIRHADHPLVLAWYAENLAMRHPKMKGCPLGVANPQVKGHAHLCGDHGLLDAVRAEKNKREAPLHVCMREHRGRGDLLRKLGLSNQPREGFEGYLRALSRSFFTLSPNGIGVDCHRTWEALYMGCIPIIVRNPMVETGMYDGLPVVILDSWDAFHAADCTMEKHRAIWGDFDPSVLAAERFVPELDWARRGAAPDLGRKDAVFRHTGVWSLGDGTRGVLHENGKFMRLDRAGGVRESGLWQVTGRDAWEAGAGRRVRLSRDGDGVWLREDGTVGGRASMLEKWRRNKVLFISAKGRIGNQLFQYAHGLRLAEQFNCALAGNLKLLEGFEGIPDAVVHGRIGGVVKKTTEDRNAPAHEEMAVIGKLVEDANLDTIELIGYHQSFGHVDAVLPQLRAMLGQAEKKDAIGVHVRRADFLELGFSMDLDVGYYLAGVRRLLAHGLLAREAVVFSDDLPWCRECLVPALREVLPVRVFEGDAKAALMEMKAMAGMVIPNSSFSWWGAVLGNAKVVFPHAWKIHDGFLEPGLGLRTAPDGSILSRSCTPAAERARRLLVHGGGGWDLRVNGREGGRRTFLPDGRMADGLGWTVDRSGVVHFDGHRIRFDGDDRLIGEHVSGLRVSGIRSIGAGAP